MNGRVKRNGGEVGRSVSGHRAGWDKIRRIGPVRNGRGVVRRCGGTRVRRREGTGAAAHGSGRANEFAARLHQVRLRGLSVSGRCHATGSGPGSGKEPAVWGAGTCRSRSRPRAERMNSPQQLHEVRLRGLSVPGRCHATGLGPCRAKFSPPPRSGGGRELSSGWGSRLEARTFAPSIPYRRAMLTGAGAQPPVPLCSDSTTRPPTGMDDSMRMGMRRASSVRWNRITPSPPL